MAGKIPETFFYQKIILFASKNLRVGTPTKPLLVGQFSLQFLSTNGLAIPGGMFDFDLLENGKFETLKRFCFEKESLLRISF
ncbi:hypothetical protein A0128_03535 [Leptospira tipperaryensis]|uniref:Uncharacterized protein n=1 Tax=Leptospira tipperaryensis TaxID=2564040 RepID=A0A1D7UTS3_9LEPT|nr:hypothetical protein A0128_03535 [Leptospira tipperaryensis]